MVIAIENAEPQAMALAFKYFSWIAPPKTLDGNFKFPVPAIS
jgi:hypothetical protein